MTLWKLHSNISLIGGSNGEGWPYFNSEEGCTYMFDWETKYACIDHPLSATCSVQHEAKTFDLTALLKTNGKAIVWPVVKY